MVRVPRHHLVPRFYLKRFADDRQNLVVVTRNAPHRSTMKPVKVVCAKEGFYAMPTEDIAEGHRDGHDPEIVEQVLSQIESDTATAIETLLAGRFPPTMQDRYRITQFIALQMTRGHAFRDDTEALATLAAKTYIDTSPRSAAEGIRQWLNARGDARHDTAVQDFRARLQEEGFPRLQMSQPHMVQHLLRIALYTFHPALFTRRWRLHRFDHGCLVTSDSPVGLWSPTLPGGESHVGPLNAPMIVMPLDRRTALTLVDNGSERMVEGTPLRARQFNTAVIAEASERIFHHPGDHPLDELEIPPRTAFVDEVIGIREPGDGTLRVQHRIVKRPVPATGRTSTLRKGQHGS